MKLGRLGFFWAAGVETGFASLVSDTDLADCATVDLVAFSFVCFLLRFFLVLAFALFGSGASLLGVLAGEAAAAGCVTVSLTMRAAGLFSDADFAVSAAFATGLAAAAGASACSATVGISLSFVPCSAVTFGSCVTAASDAALSSRVAFASAGANNT